MKKLFFASIVMLAMTTSCNNAESTTAPEEQRNQTFSSKTTAREGDEKEDAAQAEIIIQKDMEAGGGTETERILCHTPYSYTHGHACVVVNNHLFNVSWQPFLDAPNHDMGVIIDDEFNPIIYTSTLVNSCNCR